MTSQKQNGQEKLLSMVEDICERVVAMERVLLTVAKRVERLGNGWLEFRRDVRGRLAGIEALILGKRK